MTDSVSSSQPWGNEVHSWETDDAFILAGRDRSGVGLRATGQEFPPEGTWGAGGAPTPHAPTSGAGAGSGSHDGATGPGDASGGGGGTGDCVCTNASDECRGGEFAPKCVRVDDACDALHACDPEYRCSSNGSCVC